MEHLGFKKEKLTEIALCCFEMAECIMLNQDIFWCKNNFPFRNRGDPSKNTSMWVASLNFKTLLKHSFQAVTKTGASLLFGHLSFFSTPFLLDENSSKTSPSFIQLGQGKISKLMWKWQDLILIKWIVNTLKSIFMHFKDHWLFVWYFLPF